MYFPESGILLQNNPEYEEFIRKIDQFLGTLQPGERKQINKDVIVDITGVTEGVVEFLFENYSKWAS